MGVVKDMIIVEDRLEEIFDNLEPISVNGNDFRPIFKYGDQKELIAFFKLKEEDNSPYPLIWLVYPYEEDHQRTKVDIQNMSLVLAVETNVEMLNEERFKTTYKNVLVPLFNNIKTVFNLANIISTDDTYRIMKFPNYSDTEEGEESQSVDVWDALKITFNCEINDWCLKPIKI